MRAFWPSVDMPSYVTDPATGKWVPRDSLSPADSGGSGGGGGGGGGGDGEVSEGSGGDTSTPDNALGAWCRGRTFRFSSRVCSGDETRTKSIKVDCMGDGTMAYEEHSKYYDSADGDTSYTDVYARGTWQCELAGGASGGSRLVLRGQKQQSREDFKHHPEANDTPRVQASDFTALFDQWTLCNSPWTNELVSES